MSSNDYAFVTRWRMNGPLDDVFDVLADSEGLAEWWPSVYLDVRTLAPGDARGVGRVLALHTKGFLPYTLRWRLTVTDVERPHRLALRAEGDFTGAGTWTLVDDAEHVDVRFDWTVRADKPLLRWLSWLLAPLFAANHSWAMARGLDSLRLELRRRRAAHDEERRAVPPPPPPTFPHARRRRG